MSVSEERELRGIWS